MQIYANNLENLAEMHSYHVRYTKTNSKKSCRDANEKEKMKIFLCWF